MNLPETVLKLNELAENGATQESLKEFEFEIPRFTTNQLGAKREILDKLDDNIISVNEAINLDPELEPIIRAKSDNFKEILNNIELNNIELPLGNIIKKGSYGNIHQTNRKDIVIKKVRGDVDLNIDFLIGHLVINELTNFCPNFIYTYGGVKNNDGDITQIAIEYIDGISLKQATENMKSRVISDWRLTIRQLTEIVVQILLALEIAYSRYKFTHYDLQCENIMIEFLPQRETLTYYLGNCKIELFTDVRARIVDYGVSYAKYGNINIGTNFLHLGIMSIPNPSYDVRRLILELNSRVRCLWIDRLSKIQMIDGNTIDTMIFPVILKYDYLNWLGNLIRNVDFDLFLTITSI